MIQAADSSNGHGPATAEDSSKVSPAPAQSNSERSDRFKNLAQKRHQGVNRGDKRGPYTKGPQPTRAAEPIPPSDPLFTPENVRYLVSVPFDIALAKTGFDGFALTPGETAALSGPGAVALNHFVTIDPRYVAAIVFSISMLKIAGEKMLLYQRHVREEQRKLDEANAGKTSGGTAS